MTQQSVYLGIGNLAIQYSELGRADAVLVPTLKEHLNCGTRLADAVEKLEQRILTDFKAGKDIHKPDYQQSLTVGIGALKDAIDRGNSVVVTKRRVVKATVVQTTSYTVDAIEWLRAFGDADAKEDQALKALQEAMKAHEIKNEVEFLDVQEELSSSVERL